MDLSRWLPWRETALFVGKVILKNNMPKARKPSSVTDSDVGDTEVMVMRFVELLKDEGVLNTLRSALYPQALSDKLDKLTETIAGLTSQLENKEIKTTALEERVERLEDECDRLEQNSRRGNLRFSGIPETGEGEDTTATVVDIINTKMAFTTPPPPQRLRRTFLSATGWARGVTLATGAAS